MKGLKIFLEKHGWEIIKYSNDTTLLYGKIKTKEQDIELLVEKRLGICPLLKTQWTINGSSYEIISNDDEKFIFNELSTLGFK